MFQSALNEFRLHGSHNGSKASFRPAVEALEERTLLCDSTGACTMGPGGPQMADPSTTDALLYSILQGQAALLARMGQRFSSGNFGRVFIRNTMVFERVLMHEASDLLTTADLANDPAAVQLGRAIVATDDQIQPAILELDKLVSQRLSGQFSHATQPIRTYLGKQVTQDVLNHPLDTAQAALQQFLNR
jgi:hypothetical protein